MKKLLVVIISLAAVSQAAAYETKFTYDKATGNSTYTTPNGTYTTTRNDSAGSTTVTTTFEKANRSFNDRALKH